MLKCHCSALMTYKRSDRITQYFMGDDLQKTPRKKGDKPYIHKRVSLVIDIVIPGWNKEKHSHIAIEAIGIPSDYMKRNPVNNPFYNKRTIDETMKIISSKRVDKKIQISADIGKGLVRTDFDYVPKEPHFVNPKPAKDDIKKMKTIRYRLDGMEVNPDLFNKIDVSIMFYPQITDAIVYPNPDGVIVNMLAEPATQGFRRGGDGIIRGIRTAYVSQKQNAYRGKPRVKPK